MRLIDADALKENMFYHEIDNTMYLEERDIDDAPTVAASPWHRVEDELPEPIHPTDPRYEAYLICDSLGYMHVADYTYSKHFPTCYSFHVNGEEETDVKYWMPLPEPPKEDE